MAKKIAGQSYYISKSKTDNPKLGAKVLADGMVSLWLEYYYGYTTNETGSIKAKRRREVLKIYIYQSPKTPIEREHNKKMLLLAEKVRFEKEQQLLQAENGYRVTSNKDVNFYDIINEVVQGAKHHKTRAGYNSSRNAFIEFLNSNKEYECYSKELKPKQITKQMCLDFADYLSATKARTTAKVYFAKFRSFILYAIEKDVLIKDVSKGITIKADVNTVTKDILSIEEIKQLLNTEFPHHNEDIKRAFIFCLYTGIRFCDVELLTFANIDVPNKILTFEQKKVAGHTSRSVVKQRLSETAIKIINRKTGDRETRLFNLPRYENCMIALHKWVAQSGINKHITWHCARHSFAVNVLSNGANIKVVSELLGHSKITTTEKYLHVIDKQKEEAINSLPTFDF